MSELVVTPGAHGTLQYIYRHEGWDVFSGVAGWTVRILDTHLSRRYLSWKGALGDIRTYYCWLFALYMCLYTTQSKGKLGRPRTHK